MRSLPLLVPALVFFSTLLAGCPSCVRPEPRGAGTGEVCDESIPCADRLACTGGVCVAAGDGGTSSSSSSSGTTSSGGGDGGTPQCSVRLDCPFEGSIDGRDCVGGQCVWLSCEGDGQCGARRCVEGQCSDIDRCQLDGDCGNGICEEGVCQPGCESNDECNAGQPIPVFVCDVGRCRQRCLGDMTCALNGGICEAGVCVPPQCQTGGDCGGPNSECQNGRCVEFTPCGDDEDCGDPALFCAPEGACRERPPCGADSDCAPDGICELGRCHPAEDCTTTEDCPAGSECVADRCVPAAECRGNSECTAPEICRAGVCSPAPVATVSRVVIATPHGLCDPLLDNRSACTLTVRPGQSVALSALTLDAAGRIIVGVPVDWTSDLLAAADIVAGPSVETVLTGGVEAGTARIQAATAQVTSPALNVVNLGPPPAGIRVAVVEAATGLAVRNAVVVVGSEQATTGPDGTAAIDVTALTPPWTISVFHAQFDYVTFTNVGADAGGGLDAVVPLTPVRPLQAAAGLRGSVDIVNATSTGPVSLALAGVSAPSVPGLSFAQLLGETFFVDVELPFIGSQQVPLPGGIIVSADVPVIGHQDFKTSFDALGTGGRRIAWTFGGRMPLSAVQGLIGMNDPVNAIMSLVRNFQGLTHGLTTGYLLTELPFVRDGDTDFDGENDVDNDGDENEQVPDYLAFPQASLTVRQEQTLRTGVRTGAFPAGGEQALVAAGAKVPGHGFVPLGMTSVPSDEATGGFSMKLAPRYGGLEAGHYAVAAFVFGASTGAAPGEMSLRAMSSETLPDAVDLGAFLDFPTGSSFAAGTRQLTLRGVSSSDVHRAVLAGSDGRWLVYASGGGGIQALELPALPSGMADRAQQGVAVEAVQVSTALRASSTAQQLGALLSEGGLSRLDDETEGLSRALME